jgi:hypothetical protein
MKKTMNTPGFTADAALSHGRRHYQANVVAAVYGGTAQPASQLFLPNHLLRCLKFRCNPDPITLECNWSTTIGTVNPLTGRCQ